MSTPIFVSQGKARYVGGTITELTGKDISGATFTVALSQDGSEPPETGWVAPMVSLQGPGGTLQDGTVVPPTAQRILKLLVTTTDPLGTWYCWANVEDTPEIEPILLQSFVTA